MLNSISFDRLKIFHLVYVNLSIQKAANVLNVTRSAVSQSLKNLEQELKISLFLRTSKKFQPTQEASQLFQAIDPLISQLHSTLEKIESGRSLPVGHLKIGAPMDFGSGHLTKVIGKFREQYPQVTFELHLAVPVKQLEMLSEGKIDMAFIDNGDIHAEKFPVTIQTVMREEFVLTASKRTYDRHGLKDASFKTLGVLPVVDYLPHGPVARMWFKHHYAKIPNQLDVVYSAESVRAVLNAVAHGLGVGVVPRNLLTGEFRELRIIETQKKPFVNQIMLARRLGKHSTVRESEFLQFYRKEIGS
jgi:LysR family transcriptional regulator, transcriptional activator of the cysJI operon